MNLVLQMLSLSKRANEKRLADLGEMIISMGEYSISIHVVQRFSQSFNSPIVTIGTNQIKLMFKSAIIFIL